MDPWTEKVSSFWQRPLSGECLRLQFLEGQGQSCGIGNEEVISRRALKEGIRASFQVVSFPWAGHLELLREFEAEETDGFEAFPYLRLVSSEQASAATSWFS